MGSQGRAGHTLDERHRNAMYVSALCLSPSPAAGTCCVAERSAGIGGDALCQRMIPPKEEGQPGQLCPPGFIAFGTKDAGCCPKIPSGAGRCLKPGNTCFEAAAKASDVTDTTKRATASHRTGNAGQRRVAFPGTVGCCAHGRPDRIRCAEGTPFVRNCGRSK